MERGTILSVHSAGGTIARSGSVGVRFYSDGIISKDRVGLKQGDAVWFEVQTFQNDHVAINIRKCH